MAWSVVVKRFHGSFYLICLNFGKFYSILVHVGDLNAEINPCILHKNSSIQHTRRPRHETQGLPHEPFPAQRQPKSAGFSTRAIHCGYNPHDHQGALVPPIYTSATFAFPDVAYGVRCFTGEESGYFYTRIANPTLALLEARLTSLEQGAGAVVFGSGMGAITATLWSMLEPGDEVLADMTLYGCTFAFLNHGLTRFGVTVRHVDMTDPQKVAQAMGPKTRVVYFESPANPNMRLVDIEAVAAIAHQGGAKVVVDNTYCTPYLQQPLLLGADVSVHSMTKYLGGHGDLTAGAAIFADAELAAARAPVSA